MPQDEHLPTGRPTHYGMLRQNLFPMFYPMGMIEPRYTGESTIRYYQDYMRFANSISLAVEPGEIIMPRGQRRAEVEEKVVSEPLEKGQLIVINGERTDSGVKFFMKSPIIADWIKAQSKESLTAGDELGYPYVAGKRFRKLKRECPTIPAPHDMSRNAEYSAWLLLDDQLGEGVEYNFEGMIPKDTVEKIMVNIRKSAISIYKSFISPYTVSVKVLINEEF